MVELLLRSISAELSWDHDNLEGSVSCDLEASYHNMEKAGLKTYPVSVKYQFCGYPPVPVVFVVI
jgi:hypothetical protein